MSPVLGYWDIRGLADSIRLLLAHAKVEYEDKRYKIGPAPDFERPEWLKDKFALGLDFPNLPYYIDGDVKLSQSLAIIRYLGCKYNLAGTTPTEVAKLDEVEQESRDFVLSLIKCFYTPHPEFEKAKETLLGSVNDKLDLFQKFLGEKKYVIGDRITYVDFLWYTALDFLKSFESSLFENRKSLREYLERIEALPEIDKYMKSDKFNKFPMTGPMATFGGHKE